MFRRKVLLDTADWRVYTREILLLGYGRLKVTRPGGQTIRATSLESARLWRILMELQAVGHAKSAQDLLFIQVLTDFAIALDNKPKSEGLFSGGARYSMFFETLDPTMQAMSYVQYQRAPFA